MIYSGDDHYKEIEKTIIAEIRRGGSCRVGWAAKEVLNENQQNHVHDKIAARITKSGKFAKERNAKFPQDWNIVFSGKNWAQRNPTTWDVIKVVSGAVIGFLLRVLTEA